MRSITIKYYIYVTWHTGILGGLGGGFSHQSSDLSHLLYSLQKVVACACSNTGFEWHMVVNYSANLQTTSVILAKGAQDNLRHM